MGGVVLYVVKQSLQKALIAMGSCDAEDFLSPMLQPPIRWQQELHTSAIPPIYSCQHKFASRDLVSML
jgi:hypothetical protein